MLMHEDLDIQSGNYITLYHRVDGKIKARRWVNPLWNTGGYSESEAKEVLNLIQTEQELDGYEDSVLFMDVDEWKEQNE